MTLLGLSGIAVAQPLLSVFGENPEFFVFVNARRADTVIFAALVLLVPPLTMFLVVALARLAGQRPAATVHLVFVGFLSYLFAVQLASDPSPGLLAVLVGFGVGVAVAWLYRGYRGFRIWTRVLIFVPVVAALSFLFWSPTGELFTAEAVAPVEAEEVLLVPEEDLPSVIFLVLDEFPTRVLLSSDGTIDETRYPNFARLARESTWYRSHSTVSSRTDFAVPAMLTSQEPRDVEPLFTNHPDNLFRLLGETHHLTVSESLTALCPPSQCGYGPVAPPLKAGGAATEPVTATAPISQDFDAEPLYDRAVDVFLDRVVPGRDASGSQADFEETFVAVTTTAPPPSTSSSSILPDPDADDDITVEDFWIRVRTAPDGQPARYQDMLDTIVPTDEPTLWFLHLLLPHFPWRFHPDGTEYAITAGVGELDRDRTNAWVNDLNQARLALQTEYLDALLGEMLSRFDEAGIYQDAVLVVAADHGESFELNVLGRDFENGRPSDVLYTPLFIRHPRQPAGGISDDNVSVLDILPTVAAATGVRVPWEVAGVDLATDGAAARDGTKTVWRFQGEFEPQETGVFQFDQRDLDAELTRPDLPERRTSDEVLLAPLYERFGTAVDLYGQSFSELTPFPATASATVDDRGLIESPPADGVPLGVVSGTIGDNSATADAVAVIAIDDRIVAFSPITEFQGRDQAFVALLPPDALAAGGSHRIDVGWYTEAASLSPLEVR